MTTPLILDILHGSMKDGPGVRTTAYLKGCPLSCIWCHCPATALVPQRDVVWQADCRLGCDRCCYCCPDGGAARPGPSPQSSTNFRACGSCARSCPTGARAVYGRCYSVEELVPILLEEQELHRATGGGVTIVSANPTLHCGYLSLLLQHLKRAGTHLALQTSGMFDYETFRGELLPYFDLVYYDLKFIDPTAHRVYTGVGNETILANFRLLADDMEERLIPRVPMVPGITATDQNLAGIAAFLREVGASASVLLPYLPGSMIPATLPSV